ncbi:MAG: 3-hydroxy-3-methylglutaryl CoA synthase, partial [bacterium]
MVGITSHGGYIPRFRLKREAMVAANGWSNPGLKGYAKAERSMCNWDEDSLTMAVEAARGCLAGRSRGGIAVVYLASTTLPFADRQNAGVLANALSLGEELATLDITSSQRAGTSGLIQALAAVGDAGEGLFVASDNRRTKTGGVQEMMYGDGAAAFTLGTKGVIAEFKASHSVAVDFVDHYRASGSDFDYNWEERWIRDEGYMKIVPRALEGLFAKAGVAGGDIAHFILPCVIRNVPRNLAKKFDISEGALRDNLHTVCGETGAAHPLLMLAHALEEAKPGDKL